LSSFPSGNAVPRLTAPLLRRRAVGSTASWAHMRGGGPIRGLHDRRGSTGITCLDGSSDGLGELLTGVPEHNFGHPNGIQVRRS
jgi:hypothetical protein